MGCLRRLGCLVVLIGLAAAAWYTRDRWLPLLGRGPASHAGPPAAPAVAWELLTPEGARKAKEAIAGLAGRSGKVFANISPGDFTAYVFDSLSHQIPASALGTTAAVIGDSLFLRAEVKSADLGADALPGPLRTVLGEREPIQFGGTLEIVRPGLGEYRVNSIRIHDFPVPGPAIPKLLAALDHGPRPAAVSPNAMPLVVPMHIADVRVHNGKITLYKAGP
jgi:hypothetical protein